MTTPSRQDTPTLDPMLQTLLPTLSDDPVSRVLSMMLEQRQREEDPSTENDNVAESIESHREAIERITRLIGRVRSELRGIDGRITLIAAAFQACPRCWGQDLMCPECGGQGTPVMQEINEEKAGSSGRGGV